MIKSVCDYQARVGVDKKIKDRWNTGMMSGSVYQEA